MKEIQNQRVQVTIKSAGEIGKSFKKFKELNNAWTSLLRFSRQIIDNNCTRKKEEVI